MNVVSDSSLPVSGVMAAVEQGRMLDAWEIARSSGLELAAWPHGEARRLAANLATTLGDSRLGRALDWLNWRQDRDHPTWYFRALFLRAAWSDSVRLAAEIEKRLTRDLPDDSRAELLAYQAWGRAAHRDFEPAYGKISRALSLAPGDAWLHVQHSAILEAHDRYAEALEAARHACDLKPVYRPAVLQCADVLIHLGRDDEALGLLTAAHNATQNAAFSLKMQVLHSEREDHIQALRCLDEAERLSPLANDSLKKWFAGRRADFLYLAGDIDGCLEWCDRKGGGFQKTIAASLRRPGARDRSRVKLGVPFVRQHQMTCAPATLSALAAYWGKTHDHLEIADAICHEGTPWHKERGWAASHGFIAREFRVTRESVCGLIDRGLPFTLTTQWTTGAHLQACIGYDQRTDVILLRDPTERHYGEMTFAGLIEDHPLDGPRGMLLLPEEDSTLADGVHLPDEAAYEANYELLVALDGHDRWKVEGALSTLRAVAPGRPLALQGEARVAAYLNDWTRELAATDALLAHAADHGPLLMRKSYLLNRLGRRDEQRAMLEGAVGKDPVFISELGELLLEDARELPLAEHFLRRALRQRRGEARCYESLARCRSKQHRHEEAAALRRAAASLAPGFDGYARAYFDTCRILRRTDEGLEFLRARTLNHGRKDGGPWITLASCLDAVRNDREAVAVLEEARATRPDDGALLLEAGGLMAGWGGELRDLGMNWVEAARSKVSERDWLEKSARLADFVGERRLAIQHWRSLLAIQPLATDAWRALTRLVAEEQGEAAALALLDQATARYPDQVSLWALQAEWRRRRPEGSLAALNRMLALDPRDRWALRERALRLVETGRGDEALADVREALALDPREAASHGILASVLKELGREEEARESFKEALRLDIDYTFAARELMGLSPDRGVSVKSLHFIAAEMRRQVSSGDIVPVYQELAWRFIEPPVLLGELQEFCQERPDLWQTWSARLEQALRMQSDSEAMDAAETLTGNFPLLPRAWLDLAKVHRAAGRHADEELAAARAVDLSPGWTEAARLHAEVLERLGRFPEAEAVLRRALSIEPLAGSNYGVLADFLHRGGRRAEAFELLGKATEICPFYEWGWETRARWASEDGVEEKVAAELRGACGNFGHRRDWWPVAADVWSALGRRDECIAAIRRGLELSTDDSALRDHLAYQLCLDGKHEDALEACGMRPGEERLPREMEGRRAWILMRAGQPVRAIEAMRELLEREPDYVWGSNELAGWLSSRSDWSQLRDLCRKWVRASPRDTRALGYLGQAEQNLDHMEAAKAAYARAYSLDPEYTFAGRQLADIQMKSGDFDQAAATIASLRHYSPGPNITGDAIELALKRGNPADALTEAESLIDDDRADAATFEWVAKLFAGSGHELEWGGWLAAKIKPAPVAAPGALVAFLECLPPKRQLKESIRWITRETMGSKSRISAWGWLIARGATLKRSDLLSKWAGAHRGELRGNGELWNSMGDAMVELSAIEAGLEWLGNWEQRPHDVTGDTLFNLAVLHEACGVHLTYHQQQAKVVRRIALERFPGERISNSTRAGLALNCALDGELDEARDLLGQFEPDRTSEYYRQLANLARAIAAAADSRDDEAAEHAREALGYVAKYPADKHLQRFRMRVEKALLSHQPWAKGKISRLRKRWQLPRPGDNFESGRRWFNPMAWVGFIVIVQVMRACAGV